MVKNFDHMKYTLLTLILTITLPACSKDKHDHPELTTGQQLYQHHCAECHNENGKGQFLSGVPANIAISKDSSDIINYLKTRKKHDTQMPVFKTMPLPEAKKIVKHLEQLQKKSG